MKRAVVLAAWLCASCTAIYDPYRFEFSDDVDAGPDGGAPGDSGVDAGCVAPACCTRSADCDDPLLPVCDGTQCIAACTASADCTRFDTAPACDIASGECVECMPDTEALDCVAGDACDPVAHTCTGTARGTLDQCEACLADSECMDGACIELQYIDVTRGYYCAVTRPASGCGTNVAPYRVGLADRASRSGAPAATYCGINEMLTTCEAVLATLAGAGVDTCTPGTTSDCPEGGRCETVGAAGTNRCTYSCNGVLQCPADPELSACPAVPDSFCGRQ